MLKIRREQFDVFQSVAEINFQKRLVDYLRVNHSDAVVHLSTGRMPVSQIPEEILNQMVRGGIARARSYGMSWESSLSVFVVLMFVAAPNFNDSPSIQSVLLEEKLTPNERINQLWDRTSEQDWQMVEQHYDADAWHLQPRKDHT
jgi:hypothetical protein